MTGAGRPAETSGIGHEDEGKGGVKREQAQIQGSTMPDQMLGYEASGKRQRTELESSLTSGDEEDKQHTTNIVLGGEEEKDEISSTYSSPLCEPYIPDEIYERCTDEIFDAYSPIMNKYREKKVRQMKLPTLEHFRESRLLCDPHLLPIREVGVKAVLSAAKFVLGISSFVDDEPLHRCSGFWIDWNEEEKTGIVLTTAHLIRVGHPSLDRWLGEDKYAYNARVMVHLLDDSVVEGVLLYHQKHYDLALFSVAVGKPVRLPSFSEELNSGQDIFQLGRDENLNIRITHGRAEYSNPIMSERFHYIYVYRPDEDSKLDDGGAVIDINGKVVGIINNSIRGSFIPSSILLQCLHLWRKFKCIPRLHIELKFESIKLLGPVHAEKVSRKLGIKDGLIVKEVSNGSNAEKLGIRRGDVIESVNGERISTTIELENLLLNLCKGYFECGYGLNSKVELSIQVFHVRQCLRKTRSLIANVSDEGEVVKRGSRPFIIDEDTTPLLPLKLNLERGAYHLDEEVEFEFEDEDEDGGVSFGTSHILPHELDTGTI